MVSDFEENAESNMTSIDVLYESLDKLPQHMLPQREAAIYPHQTKIEININDLDVILN